LGTSVWDCIVSTWQGLPNWHLFMHFMFGKQQPGNIHLALYLNGCAFLGLLCVVDLRPECVCLVCPQILANDETESI